MTPLTIAIIIVLIVILITILLFTLKVYNILVQKETGIQVQQGQIDATLQKREDLTMQLSVLTKRAYVFENNTQINSAKSRNSGKDASIIATMEKYPKLNSINANFTFFQEQLADVEMILRKERIHYNELVGDYKIYVRSFPTFLMAYPLGFTADKYNLFYSTATEKPEFWKDKINKIQEDKNDK